MGSVNAPGMLTQYLPFGGDNDPLPGRANRHGASFTGLPEAFKQLQIQLLKCPGGDRAIGQSPGAR
jgi:hypothetical protein